MADDPSRVSPVIRHDQGVLLRNYSPSPLQAKVEDSTATAILRQKRS